MEIIEREDLVADILVTVEEIEEPEPAGRPKGRKRTVKNSGKEAQAKK